MNSRRFWKGVGWGVAATVAMTLVMLLGLATGLNPMPKPIPAAIVAKILGPGVPQSLLMGLALASHLSYGGFWGGVLSVVAKPVTVAKGIGLGTALWLIMQLVVLPFLGWGVFGTAVTPRIAIATLVPHLIYGGAVGFLMARSEPAAPPESTA